MHPFLLQPARPGGYHDYLRIIEQRRTVAENNRGASKSCIERNTFPHKFSKVQRQKNDDGEEEDVEKCTICLCGKFYFVILMPAVILGFYASTQNWWFLRGLKLCFIKSLRSDFKAVSCTGDPMLCPPSVPISGYKIGFSLKLILRQIIVSHWNNLILSDNF